MRDNWTDKLPSLMEGHQEAPPEGLWDAVQAGLNRPKLVWWPWVAGLAAAAAVVLAVFLWKPATTTVPVASSQRLDVPEALLAETTPVPSESIAPAATVDSPVPSRAQSVPVLSIEVPEEAAQASLAPDSSTEAPEEAIQVPSAPVLSTEVPEEAVQTPSAPDSSSETVTERQEVAKDLQQEPIVWPTEPVVTRRKARITVTSSGALLAQGSTSVSQGYGVPYNPGMESATHKVARRGITTQMLSRNRESSTEAQHRQLLRVSLGANYAFSTRWSMGSGLSYSILRSDYTTLSGTTETQTTRYLHYLGVPLNLQFQLLEWRNLSLYLTAGPMVETAVGASVNTRAYVSGQPASEEQESISFRDWRWSLNAGTGLQLKLFRNGALFVQPGISWHIPGNGSVESAYTTQPLAFELDFGLRFLL